MRDFILVFSVIGGVTAALAGPALAALFFALSLWGREAEGTAAVAMTSIAWGVAAVGIGLGLPLAWAGWQAMRNVPGRPLAVSRWGLWLAALAVVLLGGQAAATSRLAGVVMPVLQVAAAVLPALLFLALARSVAGNAAPGFTARRALGSLAWGGLGGAGLSLLIELGLAIAATIVLAAAIRLADPALAEALWALAQEAQATGQIPDLARIMDLVSAPVFVIGVLGLLGVVAPAIEELMKGAAVLLVVAAGGRPGRASGFLLGVAAGAGFALVEGILNGAAALRMPEVWAGLMIFRGAAAAMHCLASGLAGLGWQMILVERRWLAGGILGLLALSLHGAWNISVGIIGLISLSGATAADGPAAVARAGVAGLLALFLLCLWLVVVAGLALIPWRLAVAERLETATTPAKPTCVG